MEKLFSHLTISTPDNIGNNRHQNPSKSLLKMFYHR